MVKINAVLPVRDRRKSCASSCSILRRLQHHLAGSLLQVYNSPEETSDKQKTKGVLFFFKWRHGRVIFLKNVNVKKDKEKLGNVPDLRQLKRHGS